MSEKKNIFLQIFGWIVNCYDHSFFEKIMSGIFGFFSKRANGSVIIDFFRNRYSDGRYWNKSRTAKVVRSPFAVCRSFYHKNEERIETVKKKSTCYNFFVNAGKISMRDYGTVLIALGVGMLFGTAVFMKWESVFHIVFAVFVFFFGTFLYICDESLLNVASESVIIRFLKKCVMYGDGSEIKYAEKGHLGYIKFIWIIALVAGVFLYASEPVGAFVSTVAAAMIILILFRTEVGVFLFVPLAAILPTMALAGLIALTFVSYILHLLFAKNAEYVSTPFQPWILLFLALACYAAFSSVTVVSSVKILMIYIVFTMAYVLVVNTIKSRAEWTALIILTAISATLVALYGIYQNFFLVSTTESWVDGEMFAEIKKRVYSTLDNPNVLGQYFIMMMPVVFALFIKLQGKFQKAFYAACCFVMFACLMYTWSRGAWIGVILGIGFFVLLKDRRWLAVCIAGLLIMPSILPANILTRITSIGNLNDSSTSYRVAVWIGSLRLLKDYWFCGIGLGPDAFLEIYPQYALGGAGFALHSHNFYLQWIVDMGIMGIIVYVGIIALAWKQIVSVKEKNTLIKNVLLAMSGAILGYIFQGMAENLWYNYRMILMFWVYLGMLQSGVMLADDKIQRKDVLK